MFAFQVKSRMTEEAEKVEKSAEDDEKAMMSMRLAYQDLSVEKKKQVCALLKLIWHVREVVIAPREGSPFSPRWHVCESSLLSFVRKIISDVAVLIGSAIGSALKA